MDDAMTGAALHERFYCSPGLRIETQERLTTLQFTQIDARLQRIEEAMERLEKRLWVTVYGVAAVVLAQGMQSLIAAGGAG